MILLASAECIAFHVQGPKADTAFSSLRVRTAGFWASVLFSKAWMTS